LSVVVVVPGDLEARTGGYGYDRRIIAGLRARAWQVDVVQLDDSFPLPTPAARDDAERALAAIPDGRTVLVDGLALGALPEAAARHAARLTIVALVHHPLAAETGLDPAIAAALEQSERHALGSARSVIVTSRATAAALEGYGVSADRITVVEPGTDPAPLARGSPPSLVAHASSDGGAVRSAEGAKAGSPQPEDVALLCVATLTPRKGHDLLIRALASIPNRNWRLTCAGGLDRDPAVASRIRGLVREFAFDDRVALVGDMDAGGLAVEYDRADVFVLPTLYEGYGMAVAEALARGLPVISTATGAIRELVCGEPAASGPHNDAGIVVPPGDVTAFADALSQVLGDARLRDRLAAGARSVREHLRTWDEAADTMAQALGRSRGEFSAAWLALREPADHAARSAAIARTVADAIQPRGELRALDLGAGAGSNMRYLAPRLPTPQRWLLVDRDAALLAHAARAPMSDVRIETRQLDLAGIADDPMMTLFDGQALVTASALLDLVSERWLLALAARCRHAGAAALFALSYDGRIHAWG
jgi:glycosyltransferase involved in cell wall biosynthesis